ncbi:MAG: hypothetical protein OEL89_00300 [Candidatus Peregrinibacteria bacterium]|nr:hypothetical protein [Candidatus Peregrinibacteria bacterium]
MDNELKEILLYEIRQNRKFIAELQISVTTIKTKIGTASLLFGVLGSIIVQMVIFFK